MSLRETWHRCPSWTDLRVLGQSKLIRTSYIWIFIVPIAVRLIAALPPELVLPYIGAIHIGDIDLPFKWYLFYFSAVSAGLAHSIYLWKAPRIVRQFSTATDFSEEGRGGKQLKVFFNHIVQQNKGKLDEIDFSQNIADFYIKFCENKPDPNNLKDASRPTSAFLLVDNAKVKPACVNEAFWAVRDLADGTMRLARRACSAFLMISLVLILAVFVQNVLYVIQHLYCHA